MRIQPISPDGKNAMEYIDNLEKKMDSQEYEIESMKNQIQIMYKYIGYLEDAEKELMVMLNKYHDDNCNVCDRAYKAQDIVQFQRGVFHGCAASAMEKNDWVVNNQNR